MPKDRDQLTPEDPEDAAHLASHRGQGTGGTGQDLLGSGPGKAGSAGIRGDEETPTTEAGR